MTWDDIRGLFATGPPVSRETDEPPKQTLNRIDQECRQLENKLSNLRSRRNRILAETR